MAKRTLARISDILKANINEMLDRAEEPDKMIRQMIRDMEEAVNKATASVGTAVANHKRLERQCSEKQSQVEEWQRKAERAVTTGEDDWARRALERKAMFVRAATELAPALEESRQTADQLRNQLRELKAKLEEARTRQGTLVARHHAAEARKRLAQSISGLEYNAFSSFERFEQKVEEGEAEASAHAEISGEIGDLEKEIRQVDINRAVDDELQALKAQLKKED